MPGERDEVVFLGEVNCPEPYTGYRVPVYRVVKAGHPMVGQIITEQQVLKEGLYHSGLAPSSSRRTSRVKKR
jgi:hypothetical protein